MEGTRRARIARAGVVHVATSLSIKESKRRALLYDSEALRGEDGAFCTVHINTMHCRLPLRIAIELLSSRVGQLCHFIRDNGLQPPPMPQDEDSALTKILEILGLGEINSALAQHANCKTPSSSVADNHADSRVMASSPIPLGSTAASSLERTGAQPSRELSEDRYTEAVQSQTLSSLPATTYSGAHTVPLRVDQNTEETSSTSIMECWDWDIDQGTSITLNSSDMNVFFGSSPPSGTLGTTSEEIPEPLSPGLSDNNSTLVEETSDTEGIDNLTDELSDRVGTLRIGPGGQTYFCGPTSNFNLPNMPISDTTETYHKTKYDALQRLDRLGNNAEVPASLEKHLTNLYFSWQNPFFRVVDRKIYEEAKAKWLEMKDTPFYSEALRNSMYVLTLSPGCR